MGLPVKPVHPGLPDDAAGIFKGMTPGQYLSSHEGRTVYYGIHQGPFGHYLLGVTEHQRICMLHFLEDREKTFHAFPYPWSEGLRYLRPERTDKIADRLFSRSGRELFPLLGIGTPFQLKIWKVLLTIPFGEKRTYGEVAEAAGSPRAFQAVGNAIGSNHIAYLIPCHRVVRKDSKPTHYRWGAWLKREILAWESGQW
jgi:AraC family transcriptional regulator, regulatory protein of adaptative response / methylated-DNA-[protein]-cysteine methyltransferase